MADSWQFMPLYVHVSIRDAVVLSFQIVNLCSLIWENPHKFVPLVIKLKREVSANLGRVTKTQDTAVSFGGLLCYSRILSTKYTSGVGTTGAPGAGAPP